jgi:hypothetical protein
VGLRYRTSPKPEIAAVALTVRRQSQFQFPLVRLITTQPKFASLASSQALWCCRGSGHQRRPNGICNFLKSFRIQLRFYSGGFV